MTSYKDILCKNITKIEGEKTNSSNDGCTKGRSEEVKTITVADMILALSKLPHDAKLVMTQSGYYCNSDFADIMLPEPFIVGTNLAPTRYGGSQNLNYIGLPDGTQVYRIGHSEQWY